MESKYDVYSETIKKLAMDGYTFAEIRKVLIVRGCYKPDTSSISKYVKRNFPDIERPEKRRTSFEDRVSQDKGYCDARCKKCKYHTTLTGIGETIIACMYVVDEHKLKDCKGGKECKYFVKGRRIPRKSISLLD